MKVEQGRVDSFWMGARSRFHVEPSQLVFITFVLAGLAAPDVISSRLLQVLSDAYLGVTVYVAATILPIQWFGCRLEAKTLVSGLENRLLRIPFAAFLGALPGCGGAIVVTAAFSKGKFCFPSVVAVLTATMGDAAFLLIANSPSTAGMMMLVGFGVGALTGLIVSALHHQDFLRPGVPRALCKQTLPLQRIAGYQPMTSGGLVGFSLWWVLLVMGLGLSVLPESVFTFVGLNPAGLVLPVGGVGAVFCLLSLLLAPPSLSHCSFRSRGPIEETIGTTNGVTVWVIAAFLIYEVGSVVSPFGLQDTFSGGEVWMPVIGTLVGLLPSCGPQVLFTDFYLRDFVDLPGLVANGISNDGDALLPMLAIAPRAALLSLVYTAIPALLAGYSFYWLLRSPL